jgi:hypothetical protein
MAKVLKQVHSQESDSPTGVFYHPNLLFSIGSPDLHTGI